MARQREDRRRGERFKIQCVVNITMMGARNEPLQVKGDLHDIGAFGARLHTSRLIEAGARVTMDVNFPSPRQGMTIMRFEGIVARALMPHEIAVEFDHAGKFLRRGLELLQSPERSKPMNAKTESP